MEFDINVNREVLPFVLRYPSLFPQIPPSVLPRDGRRHSRHQYGTGGEMCLEYRPDNWDPSVNGAMMIGSTYRLLSGEQPSQGERAVVADAHWTTLGQQLRDAKARFLTTPGLRGFIAQMAVGTCASGTAIDCVAPGETWVAHVTAIGPPSQPEWTETEIPSVPVKPNPAVLIRVSALDEAKIIEYEDVEKLLSAAAGSESLPANEGGNVRIVVVADEKSARMFYTFRHQGEWKVLPYRTVDLESELRRLSSTYRNLEAKKVGILGAGSLGSKIRGHARQERRSVLRARR